MRDDFQTELNRVVERLRTMPLTKLQTCTPDAWGTAQQILLLTPDTPPQLPQIADHACGDQFAVIGQDFLKSANEEAAIAEATAALIELRRILP